MRPFYWRKRLMHAKAQHVCVLQAFTHQGHQYKHFASFHSQPLAVNFGYSDSGFQGAVLTWRSGCHAQHWGGHLQLARQAVSTLLAGQMARELNFTDITN